VTLILDSGGISALAGQRARLLELRRRGLWPPQIPAVVLVEALTGDHRRDHDANRLLRTCQVRGVDEPLSREAARVRTVTGRASKISAVDAVVAAFAGAHSDSVVLTSDPRDLSALAEHVPVPITIVKA
jgi:predicted nucleic acid-binding protein